MKSIKKLPAILIFGFSLCMVNLYANSKVIVHTDYIYLNENILGYWDYSVTDVDPMYQKGVLHVLKEDGNYVVNLELPSGAIPTQEVEVNGNELKFALYVEGERVGVTIVFEEDTLTGSGSSSSGPFTITGMRKAQPE